MRRLAAESGTVERLIHFSDMGADLKHGSRRMRTKAQGDADLMRIFPDATIMKCVGYWGFTIFWCRPMSSCAAINPLGLR